MDNLKAFLSKRNKDQPFCYWFGPTNVHRKWTRGFGKKIWGLNPEDLEGKMPSFLPDVPEVREDLADYFGEALGFDMALGVLQEELKKVGELDNTIIVVCGDHGAPGFPHGKCNIYDFGSRVPLTGDGGGTGNSCGATSSGAGPQAVLLALCMLALLRRRRSVRE